jgi:excisionase family DNA binding protein
MRLLSPKDLADALGVSESSLKRWTDAGKIRATRTDGGHRRIPLAEAVRFIRATGTPVVRPELLDMPEVATAQQDNVVVGESLFQRLRDGDARGVRGWILARYLGGASLAELCDGPIRSAMYDLGELWRHDEEGIFIEHRATDLCLQALAHLRGTYDPPADAPVALGATPEDDPYLLPSFMAAAVVAAAGLRAINLGPDTPLSAMQAAYAHHRPALVWVSATAPIAAPRAKAIARWLESLPRATVAVVGGQHRAAIAAGTELRVVISMAELSTIASRVSSRR